MTQIVPTQWYDNLVSDCRTIQEESRIVVGSQLLEFKWKLGDRIYRDYHRFGRYEDGDKTQEELAKDLDLGNRQRVSELVRYREYVGANFSVWLEKSADASALPWRNIVHYLLPTRRKTLSETSTMPIPNGKYRTLVIDPPWKMEKILREVRPNQDLMEYGASSIEEIQALPIPNLAFEEGCHVYLWTTHKHLPDAFELLRGWGVSYECLLTWIKNVGFTPFSWMYSTEHVLFGRVGNLELLKKGERVDFHAKVREHSRKPDEFYELVREVSPEPRLDMFAREKHEGFEVWGNEVDRFRTMDI